MQEMGKETGKTFKSRKDRNIGQIVTSGYLLFAAVLMCTLSDQDTRVRDVKEQSTDLAHTT